MTTYRIESEDGGCCGCLVLLFILAIVCVIAGAAFGLGQSFFA